ncbi:MAG: AAA family ATPase [Anaerolineales bacterium]
MTDLPIPAGFRAEILQQVVRWLRSGESCSLIGVGSSGKSNIARHLARADVRREYFQAEAGVTLVVYLNCKPFAQRPPSALYLHALDQLSRTLAEAEDGPRGQQTAVDELWQAAQAQPEALARRNLDVALGRLVQAGARHILFILDDCDDLFAMAPPVLFSDLRGLRDNYKVVVAYLTLTRREPVFLRPDTREYEELFELLSAPGHTIPVAPYVEADGLLMLRRLAARQSPPRQLADAAARQLFMLGGGHAGLLRALFFASQVDPNEGSLSTVAAEKLAEHPDVEAECRKIWDSLEIEEQAALTALAEGVPPDSDGLHRLERRGLVHPRLNGRYEFFSPVFEKNLPSGTAAPAPAAAEPLSVEFTGVGRQARVNGELVSGLLAPEYELLRCLAEARPAPCSRMTLIETMRRAEQTERSDKVAGDPLRRLDEYVRHLQAKLGAAGRFIHPAGDGYRLSAAEETA